MGFSAIWFLIGALAGCVLLTMQIVRQRTLVLALAAMLTLYVIGLPIDYWGRVVYQWLNPIQENRTSIIMGLVPTILIGALMLLPSPLIPSRPKPVYFLVGLYIYIGATRTIHNGVIDGVLTMLLAIFTLATIVIVVQRMSDDWSDFFIFPRVIAIAMAAFLGATAIQ